ncbi:hypothetical protein [Burkholderia cepacia]|uniref:hypothetical protein n=1 Tax=Burkholderia cepacia TaxID=292 RepID=UPI0012D9C2C5|nr:hypothetical protein [Burkholderia cepacia]
MRFLRALWNYFTRSLRSETEPPLLPGAVGADFVSADGKVARFIFNKRDIYANGTPRPKAFEPELHPDLGRYETSVCGLNGVHDDRLWHLGRTIRSDKTAVAIAEISVADIRAAHLACEPLPQADYDEHGVILGWNSDPDAKDARMSAQQDLVAAISAQHVRKPPADPAPD